MLFEFFECQVMPKVNNKIVQNIFLCYQIRRIKKYFQPKFDYQMMFFKKDIKFLKQSSRETYIK